jgi:hypothetical protein
MPRHSTSARFTFCILLFTLFASLSYAGRFEAHLARRAHKYAFAAPSKSKISWNIVGKRASLGTSTKTISYSSLAKSGSITQTLINKCVANCQKTKKCTFVQVFQASSSSYGTVICSLHTDYIPSHLAKYSTNAKSIGGGKIKTTYGLRMLPSTTTTSTTHKATSTSKKATITSTLKATSTTAVATRTGLPPSPKGATLIQLRPCSGVTASIPMFVNSQYNRSTTTSAYIVQHGNERDFDTYFSAVYKTIGENGVVIAPNSYVTTDAPSPKSWFQPEINLAWVNGSGTWYIGADAVAPTNGTHALNGALCSSYSTYDAILDHLSSKTLFPNLSKIYFVSHSGGANMVSRFSQIYDNPKSLSIRYILANSANNAYFTDARPENKTFLDNCSSSSTYRYPYQLVTTGMPRYVANKFTNVEDTFKRWIARDVIILTGNLDTAVAYPGGAENCASQAQGGTDRRDRNYAWWAYQNILVGSPANVTGFFGYHNLSTKFHHQNCVVDKVGHDAVKMFTSVCGVAAMTQAKVPAGVPPSS